MTKKGYHYFCAVENNKIIEISKLTPSRMLDLIRFLIAEFGDEDYDSVTDIFNHWPVDFSLKNKKPVQSLYVDYNKEHEVIGMGYVVYSSNKTKAEELMKEYLKGER